MQAPSTTELFNAPALRSGVEIQTDESGIALIYRDQSCDITIEGNAKESLLAMIHSMKHAPVSISELRAVHSSIAETIDPFLEELDRLGLVTESRYESPINILSGIEFNSRVRDLANRAIHRRCKSQFFNMMSEGKLTRDILIGYALEYYYLVRAAPGLIAPALAHADSRANQRAIQKFLVSELDHDLMLAQSLESVGIDVKQLDYLQPLPSTFALCSALGVFARQHLLSFKSILFLFEIPSIEFNQILGDACEKLGLPELFWRPLLRHAHINDALDHDDITADLLKDLTAISREEQLVVEKNIVLTVETMALQDEEVVEYYGRPGALIPRIYTNK